MAVVLPFQKKARDEDPEKTNQALRNLNRLVAEDMKKVNETIVSRMDSSVPLIPELAGHLIASGGKRLRPALTLACAKLVGYEGTRHIDLAVCVEFIHTATLLHDDVVDHSDLRRGKESANVLWGNQASVLVGDFLFSRSFQLMVRDGSLKILKLLSDTSAVIAEGEVLQLTAANELGTNEEAYLNIITAKTATLFAAAAQVGAMVAERPAEEEKALECFGRNFGIAFQLVDDALDYSAKQATLGKNIGDDFREGKVTLPIVLAYMRGGEDERAFWQRTIGQADQKNGDFEQACRYMEAHGAINDTIERARHYGAMARDALGVFGPSEPRQILSDLIDFCVDRAY